MLVAQMDTRPAPRRHAAHFYDDASFDSVVAGALQDAILDGRPVFIVATQAHRDALVALLRRNGEHPSLRVVDAAETLAAFMRDGHPDSALFDAVVGGLVRELAAHGRPPIVFGEMVALLWAEGNVGGCLELEQLWNGLATTEDFSLLCAYPAWLASTSEEAFESVCALHSHVLREKEGWEAMRDEAAEVFACAPAAVPAARRFVTDTLRGWDLSHIVDDAAIVVTELATNAVVHAGTEFVVKLTRRKGRIHIAVSDGNRTGFVQPSPPDAGAGSGRGLHLVGAIARRWGSGLNGEGKLVWAEINSDDLV